MIQDDLAEMTAQILLDTHAILFQPEHPFFFSSGWASPVFVDCKRVISYPLARTTLIELAIRKILSTVGYEAFDIIAGGEGAGVPFAAMIADRLHLPLVVVRQHAMGFGPLAQADGVLEPGNRVLLVDDLTTDGRTKAVFCQGLRRAGAVVHQAFVLFKYGIFDHVIRDLDQLDVTLFALATWTDVLQVARQRNSLAPEILAGIEAYVVDPIGWSEAHGGIGTGRDKEV
jgi:orotate phosphoribosyltransferase